MVIKIFLLLIFSTELLGQKIVTSGQTFQVRDGQDIDLPCYAEKYDEEITWKREDDLIAVDEDILSEDNRYEVRRDGGNSTLTIKNAEPYDTASYTCSIVNPPMEIVHKIVVNNPPKVTISPDSNPVQFSNGETVIATCNGEGNPLPEIKWSKKGGALPAEAEVKGRQLSFKATPESAGEYICVGSNINGKSSRSITVQVNVSDINSSAEHVKPWVESLVGSYLPVSRGDTLNISCKFDGYPVPMVDWLFNGFKIKLSDSRFKNTVEYDQRESNYTVTSLELKDLDDDMFGDYTCRVSNNIGTDQKVVHVSGRPGPSNIQVDGTFVTWTAFSKDPVLEYALLYRSASEDTFTHREQFRIDKRDQTGPMEWTHSVNVLPYLKPGETYHIQVEARNSFGWGSMARNYVVVTAPDNNEANIIYPFHSGHARVEVSEVAAAGSSSFVALAAAIPMVLFRLI